MGEGLLRARAAALRSSFGNTPTRIAALAALRGNPGAWTKRSAEDWRPKDKAQPKITGSMMKALVRAGIVKVTETSVRGGFLAVEPDLRPGEGE